MKRTYSILVLTLLAGLMSITAHADLLEQIFVENAFRPAVLEETQSLTAETYAQQVGDDVFIYSYKTGAVVDTLFDMERANGDKPLHIEGYVPGPDGCRYALVYSNVQKIFRRSFTADYYIYDRRKHTITALSDTMPVSEPVFSPDGKYIAFSRGCNLYIHKLDFHTEVAVTTDGKEGEIINGTPDWLYEEEFATTCLYAFSADSKQLAFVRLDERPVPTFSWNEYLSAPGQGFTYPVAQNLRYPRSGEKNAVASLVVYDTKYKSLKTMQISTLREDSYIPVIRWTNATAENETGDVCAMVLNRDQNKLELYNCNPKTTLSTCVYREESKTFCVNYELAEQMIILSDNRFILLSEADGYAHAYLYSAVGSKLRQLTTGNYDVTALYGYDEATQTLYYQAADKDPMTRYVYALNVKKNQVTALTPEPGMHDATFSKGLTYYVSRDQSVTTPTHYALYDRTGKRVRELLRNDEVKARFEAANLPVKEFWTVPAADGTMLNGWMLKPKDFDASKKYPVLFYHYDGPSSQEVLNRWKIGWEEYLAAECGYIVLCVDARGTDARGRAFREFTYRQIGVLEAKDQVAVANYVKANMPFVDGERMAIWGWSYGGYSTLMTLSEQGSPFCCGMAVAPVTDWRLYDSAYTERYMRRPQVNEDGYDRSSALGRVSQLQGDVLIVQGMADDNVHAQNVYLYVEALVQAGKQVDMMVYPDDNHFLRKRANHIHVYRTLTRYLREHND